MNTHDTYLRPFRFVFLLAALVLFGATFWIGTDIFSAGFARGEYPVELSANNAISMALPEGLTESQSESPGIRDLYAQINDELYSPIHHPEVSRQAAINPAEGLLKAATGPATPGKVQCSLKTSVSSLDNINGVALNSKECF